jgi:YD repeat-containing protein
MATAVPTHAVSVPLGKGPSTFKNDLSQNGVVRPPLNSLYLLQRDIQTRDDGPGIVFARHYDSFDTRVTPLGPGWTHNYNSRLNDPGDGTGNLILVRADNLSITFTRTSTGTFTTEPWNGVSLQTQADGSYLVTSTDGIKWLYGTDGKLRTITDAAGYVTKLTYDKVGDLVSIADPAGRGSLSLSYNPQTHFLVSVSDWMTPPRVVRYSYDDQGRLHTVTDRDGQVTTYSYDGKTMHLTTLVDARGHAALTITYAPDGRVLQECNTRTVQTGHCYTFENRTNADGSLTRSMGQAPSSFAPNWQPTIIQNYNPQGWLLRSSEQPGPNDTPMVQVFTYTSAGQPVPPTESGGSTPPIKGSPLAKSPQIPRPSDDDLHPEYAIPNFLDLAVADGASDVTRDAFGRITSLVIPSDLAGEGFTGKIAITYDLEDRPVRIAPADSANADTAATTLRYDEVGNLIEITQADGSYRRYTRDERDTVSDMVDSSGREAHYTFDEYGHPASMETIDPTTKTHTMTKYVVDARDRLRRVELYPTWPNKAVGEVVEYAYDAAGKQTLYQVPW